MYISELFNVMISKSYNNSCTQELELYCQLLVYTVRYEKINHFEFDKTTKCGKWHVNDYQLTDTF